MFFPYVRPFLIQQRPFNDFFDIVQQHVTTKRKFEFAKALEKHFGQQIDKRTRQTTHTVLMLSQKCVCVCVDYQTNNKEHIDK